MKDDSTVVPYVVWNNFGHNDGNTVMDDNSGHERKMLRPTRKLFDERIVTFCKDEHPLYTLLSITLMFSERSVDTRDSHSENEAYRISRTATGIGTSINAIHPVKHRLGI